LWSLEYINDLVDDTIDLTFLYMQSGFINQFSFIYYTVNLAWVILKEI